MAIMVIYDTPGVTQQQYDQVTERVLKQTTLPVAGQLFHASSPSADGRRTVDVWESQEAADRFFRDHQPTNHCSAPLGMARGGAGMLR